MDRPLVVACLTLGGSSQKAFDPSVQLLAEAVELAPYAVNVFDAISASDEADVFAGTWLDTGEPSDLAVSPPFDPAPSSPVLVMRWHTQMGLNGAPRTILSRRAAGRPFQATHYDQGESTLVAAAIDIARFLGDVHASISGSGRDNHGWLTATEVLMRRIETLLDERDHLEATLAQVYEDRDTAQARIATLELQLKALGSERYGAKEEKADPNVVLHIAMVVVTLLAPLLGVLADHVLEGPTRATVEQAQHVEVECRSYIEVWGGEEEAGPPPPRAEGRELNPSLKAPHPEDLGPMLRAARHRLNLNQAELAQRLGVTQGSISSWETGRTRPQPRFVDHIYRFLQDAGMEWPT